MLNKCIDIIINKPYYISVDKDKEQNFMTRNETVYTDALLNIGLPQLADQFKASIRFSNKDKELIKARDEEFLKKYDNWENHPTRMVILELVK